MIARRHRSERPSRSRMPDNERVVGMVVRWRRPWWPFWRYRDILHEDDVDALQFYRLTEPKLRRGYRVETGLLYADEVGR